MSTITDTIDAIRSPDDDARSAAQRRLDSLTMPHWALGRLMDLALDLAAAQGRIDLRLERRVIAVAAGDHGVADQGVSAFPQAVTVQMVHNFLAGGAAINALARSSRTDVAVADFGVAGDLSLLVGRGLLRDCKVAPGTKDFSRGPAMERDQAIAAVEHGIAWGRELARAYDVIGTGEMGIANTTPATAICCAITGCAIATATGRGTGIDDHALDHKRTIIESALARMQPNPADGLDVLAKVGGFEIGGLAGVILGAAAEGTVVVVDGFISTAAALIADAISTRVRPYLVCAHNSVEPGHRAMLTHLDKPALLDLSLRLGEGTGAALAMTLLDAAAAVLRDIATFEEAGVSGP